MAQQDRIVVTGMGAVTPLASGVQATWDRLIAEQSGVGPNTRFDTTDFACKIAGLVPGAEAPDGFDPDRVLSAKEQRKSDLFIHYAIAAVDEALTQAGWHPETAEEKARTATIMATGVGGFPAITNAVHTVDARGPRRLSPFTVPGFLPNLATGQISIRYGFTGPSGAPTTACAASAQSIGDAVRMIRAGEADIAVCGGAEACVDPVAIGGFSAAKALSTRNDDPPAASRPFDQGNDGFVLSEGAAALVIEAESHAAARGAQVLAVIAGYGTSTDAYHVTAGHPDGAQAQVSMRRALAMAGLAPGEVGYVNAHSTSTPVGDAAELAALGAVFGGAAGQVALSATKSATGHMLGAAGAVEAIFSILALRDGVLPPSLNIETPMEGAARFDLIANTAVRRQVDHVLSNAFGFGGVNASLILSRA
ncbi:3-oxoacyl-ACP synthase [Actibacterium mucosum KCTC 23349]|uniref:3-oxoacyl-[acyl-carrier-protein] synthase 2 n=1 Tax=Actibacterium mucosum KCTC 23349 TaxID=1454373 RepID=A0A037ZH76_9RHOB|nr:beta-ketoacyl-ACP synthase II [Actibacterium mucosum]KAJ55478.1 3-oxoacyl-ACP synthase [Actibacterium mucosum KCTC 23349]